MTSAKNYIKYVLNTCEELQDGVVIKIIQTVLQCDR